MNFDEARPEYYEGLKIFQKNTNQQEQLKKLLSKFLHHFKAGILLSSTGNPQLQAMIQKPLSWLDIGSGDGSFTRKMLEALQENAFPSPVYHGIEPDNYFWATSQQELANFSNITITQENAFGGNLHTFGEHDIVSGMNVLYFVNDFASLKKDLGETVKPAGLGLFIQNSLFTDKAGEILIGDEYKDYTAAIATEVFFPPMSQHGYDLITGKACVKDIENDGFLTDQEKQNTIITKKIIDSMGGISTETDEGQKVAKKYESRICGNDFGGTNRYVSDNLLLAYVHPDAPDELKAIVQNALKNVRNELSLDVPSSPMTNQRQTPRPLP